MDESRKASPWWLRIGHESGFTTEKCPVAACTAELLPTDAYCPEHEGLLLLRGGSALWRVLAINALRVAVAGSFVVAAYWESPLPLFASAVGLGLIVLLVPLRGYRLARYLGAALWIAAVGWGVVGQLGIGFAQARHVNSALLLIASLTWLGYAVSATRHLAAPSDGDGVRDLSRNGIAIGLLWSTTLLLLWLLVRSGTVRSYVAEYVLGYFHWLVPLSLAGVAGVAVVAALAGFLRSAGPVGAIKPALPTVSRPQGTSFVRPPTPAMAGSATTLQRLQLAGLRFSWRVETITRRIVHEAGWVLRLFAYEVTRMTVSAINAYHRWLVRACRRVAATTTYAATLLQEGGGLGVRIVARWLRAIMVPVSLLFLGAFLSLRAADKIHVYLSSGGLWHVAAGLVNGSVGLLLILAAVVALSGDEPSQTARSLQASLSIAVPNAFLLFVASAWLIGLPGTFGLGPISVGPVTLTSSAMLVLAFMYSRLSGGQPQPASG